MRLTHIKLSGFKSFTDPTTIHVPGRLVAVVGPNGCGKSNVIDAVRWVLGEASARQLRGECMQDVIFNGAATRRPAPRASVELVFDNADRGLQGVWGRYAEVSIRRQLTRQGESSYFINNQLVRRRDITDLFLGTGVGARGYAVIEQGMISRIIEARPEELRAYIEEAAGVSKYKERRRETESRLKDAADHLQRLADLQGELAKQVEKLERQAQAAERYGRLTEELARQQDLSDFVLWRQALRQADAATALHGDFRQKQDEAEELVRLLNGKIQKLREAEQEWQGQVMDLSARHAALREQRARLEEQVRSRISLQQRIGRDRMAAQARLQGIAQERLALGRELDDVGQEGEERQIELAESALRVAEYEERLPGLEAEQSEAERVLRLQQEEADRLRRELALKRQQLAHVVQTQGRHGLQQTRLNEELSALSLPAEGEAEAAREAAEGLAQGQRDSEGRLEEAEDEAGRLREALDYAESRRQSLNGRFVAAEAAQRELASVLPKGDGDDFWARTEYAQASELWRHIEVAEEWRHALSVVLAGRLNARSVGADFVPPSPLPKDGASWAYGGRPPGGETPPPQALIRQIRAGGDFGAAAHDWLDGILCAPDLDYALAHRERLGGGQSWLTPEGHQIGRAGVLLYAEDGRAALVGHRMRYEELSEELAALAPQCDAARDECGLLRQRLEQAENRVRDLAAEQRGRNVQLQAAQTRAAELLAKINQGQLRRDRIGQELRQLDEEQTALRHQADGLEADIGILDEAAEAIGQRLLQSEGGLGRVRQRLQQARLTLLEENRRHGTVEVAVHKLQQRAHNIRRQLDDLAQQEADWQGRQSELALAFENGQDPEQREMLEMLAVQIAELDERLAAAQSGLDGTRRQGGGYYAEQQSLSSALPRLQAATQTALLQQQEALINAKRFHEGLAERRADFAALEKLAGETGEGAGLEEGIRTLQQQIQALGAVNLAALQELEEARERDGYYRSQSEDVQAAIGLLEEAIAKIDGETKTRFKETFDAVNEKVQTFFPTLFGGGEATLKMAGDDLLTAGVSIMARPPGKKNSTIHLLSGGEKALTAMSLVFALFSLNPAPFCLLDEVDAPLDDANTSRFCNLVKEMSAQTQFLYISHNRLTMEMAEQLVGVTMQEKGVSRIVSVDIRQALAMAEA
ncbi:MAG: AAA family ATPase [Neisseria sp.]|nr:AAA family ATPase [Neisseria sp.]